MREREKDEFEVKPPPIADGKLSVGFGGVVVGRGRRKRDVGVGQGGHDGRVGHGSLLLRVGLLRLLGQYKRFLLLEYLDRGRRLCRFDQWRWLVSGHS